MRWQVVFSRRSQRDLRGLDAAAARRVIRAMDRFAAEGLGDVRRLQGQHDLWRLRVGDWRVRFRYEPDVAIIRVQRVLLRGRAYRR